MGQTLGRAPLLPASRHFSNLPKRLVYRLYARYSETAEGLGLTQDEFMFILSTCLKDHLEYTEKKLDLISKVPSRTAPVMFLAHSAMSTRNAWFLEGSVQPSCYLKAL